MRFFFLGGGGYISVFPYLLVKKRKVRHFKWKLISVFAMNNLISSGMAKLAPPLIWLWLSNIYAVIDIIKCLEQIKLTHFEKPAVLNSFRCHTRTRFQEFSSRSETFWLTTVFIHAKLSIITYRDSMQAHNGQTVRRSVVINK